MKYLLVIIFVLFSAFAYAEEPKSDSYYCIGEMSTGFRYNEDSEEWEQKNFRTAKYFVRRSKEKSFAWEVKEVGKSHVLYNCINDFNQYGYLFCDSMGSFKINRNNLRFLKTYTFAYYNHNPDDGSMEKSGRDPLIEIGKCSAL